MPLTLTQRGILLASDIMYRQYSVKTMGDPIPSTMKGGIVIALNHNSTDDPVILVRELARAGLVLRQVVHIDMYRRNKRKLDLVGALPIHSTFDGKGSWVQHKIKKEIEAIYAALESGHNIYIAASGKLKVGDEESINGTLVYDLINRYPNAPVMLATTRGFMFGTGTKYFTGGVQIPHEAHVQEIRSRVRNFDKQKIPVEVDIRGPFSFAGKYPNARAFNAMLETYANNPKDFGPTWLRDVRTDADVARYRNARTAEAVFTTQIDEAVFERVRQFLSSKCTVPVQEIRLESYITDELGLDSTFEAMDLRPWLEETFPIGNIDPEAHIFTVRDAVVAAQGGLAEIGTHVEEAAPTVWHKKRKAPKYMSGDNLQHAIVRECHRMGLDSIYTVHTDLATGKQIPITYRMFLYRSCMFAKFLQRRYPLEKNIGMLLPASYPAAVVTTGTLLAGKTLVPLNWTVPPNLETALKETKTNVVFSSDFFLTKSGIIIPQSAIERVYCLEDIRKRESKVRLALDHISAQEECTLWPRILARKYARSSREDTAVVLYTSGSEKEPKGVPLSHHNLMSNVRGSLAAIKGYSEDSILAFLPVFHSFGLTQLLLMSLIGGVRIIYSADPKMPKKLVHLIEKYRLTLVAGAPDFLEGIVEAARHTPEKLRSVRAFLSGGQAASEGLKQKVRNLGIEFLEGYGATETAPLLTVTPSGSTPVGVGQPVDDVEIRIVDPETFETLPTNTEGLVLARGSNVFGGYLSPHSKSPFVTTQDRKEWYNTGDLGTHDTKNNLTITGRVSDQIKHRGEMINLAMIGNALKSEWGNTESGPRVAVDGVEVTEAMPFIVLFTTDPTITLEKARDALRKRGMSALFFPTHLRRVPEIPMLGIKVNKRALNVRKVREEYLAAKA